MATKGAMGRDPKAGGGRASVGRDQGEMLRYREALNRAKGMDVNSEAYARNKAIAEATGAKYGLNWQQGLTQGAQPRQQQQNQGPLQQTDFQRNIDRMTGRQEDMTPNAQGQFRLSPGIYGSREQAQRQYDESRTLVPWGGGMGGSNPYNDKMYRYPERTISPEDYQRFIQGIYNAPQPPQQDMTANKQGQYRLSPGMYGNRQQADQQQARDMEQYNQQQEAARAAMQAVGPQQGQGQGGGRFDNMGRRLLIPGMNPELRDPRLLAGYGANEFFKGNRGDIGDRILGGGLGGGVAKKVRKWF